jgi:hypothetical protein
MGNADLRLIPSVAQRSFAMDRGRIVATLGPDAIAARRAMRRGPAP